MSYQIEDSEAVHAFTDEFTLPAVEEALAANKTVKVNMINILF